LFLSLKLISGDRYVGMDQSVTFGDRAVPEWLAVRELLASRAYSVQIRMIDGELAFPDEEPPLKWRELRVAAAGEMVTVRRAAQSVTIVCWGNATTGQRQLWNAVTWAFAESGRGTVQADHGTADAAKFLQEADLPPELRV
jgi:hypothetical protein